jgi:hypothetical protein
MDGQAIASREGRRSHRRLEGPDQLGHLIQEVARDHRLAHSPAWRASAKTTADDRFVPEEGLWTFQAAGFMHQCRSTSR